MTARSIRRAAERKAKKAARKVADRQANQTLRSPNTAAPAPPPIEVPEDRHPGTPPATARSASQAQIDANRANSQLSTGPTSDAGKAMSSQNRRSHGLAGIFQILSWEDPAEYAVLRNELHEHYRPANIVEEGYVDRMAEHTWLRRRCLSLQNDCFDPECAHRYIDDEKQFALLTRYENQNERGIDKCVNQLLKLQTARRREQIGFESEIRKEAAETRKNEAHEARLRLINARARHIEVDSDIHQTVETTVPATSKLALRIFRAPFAM